MDLCKCDKRMLSLGPLPFWLPGLPFVFCLYNYYFYLELDNTVILGEFNEPKGWSGTLIFPSYHSLLSFSVQLARRKCSSFVVPCTWCSIEKSTPCLLVTKSSPPSGGGSEKKARALHLNKLYRYTVASILITIRRCSLVILFYPPCANVEVCGTSIFCSVE